MRTLIFAAFAATVTILAPITAAQAQPAEPADVRATLNAFVSGKANVGVIAGVVNGGTVHVYTAGGFGPGTPALDQNTVFQIGSITKTFTATLLAQMVQAGDVRLDEPIQQLLPAGVHAPAYNGTPITLLNLAEQNSGLPSLPDNLKITSMLNPYAAYTTPMLHEFLSHYALTRAPGAKYEYSNLGVGLLGDLIAARAHASYADLVRERIFGPLGMNDSAMSLTPALQAHLAPGHTVDGNPQPPWTFGELGAAGAIDSTMHDMLLYLRANRAPQPVSRLEKAMAFAQEPRYPIGNGMRIGLVWMTTASGITWHNGETGGYYAFIGFDKAKNFGVVVMTNIADDTGDSVALHLLEPGSVPAPKPQPPEFSVPLTTLQRYAGVYGLTPTFTITISVENGHLYAQATGQNAYRIYASSPTAFFFKVVDAQITFNVDASGNVSGLVLHQNGVNHTAPKIR